MNIQEFREELCILKSGHQEKDVEALYKRAIKELLLDAGLYDKASEFIIDQKTTDGIIPALKEVSYSTKIDFTSKEVVRSYYDGYSILLECKKKSFTGDIDFTFSTIIQALTYLRQLRESKNIISMPLLVIFGSLEDCFVLPVDILMPFTYDLALQSNGRLYPASKAGFVEDNLKLKEILKGTISIRENMEIIRIDSAAFSFEYLLAKIREISEGISVPFELTERNIKYAFDVFCDTVLENKVMQDGSVDYAFFDKYFIPYEASSLKLSDSLSPAEKFARLKVSLFMNCVLNMDKIEVSGKEQVYSQETSNTLEVSRNIEIEGLFKMRVRILGFYSFRSRWNFNLTNAERETFKSMCDTFIENDTRRRRGDFYTPEVWVNEAHKLLEKHLGNDWKDNYVVWDCCCGTKNLTADRRFKNLYCSTLSKGDLDISQDRNKEALSFVYDFLNDDVYDFEKYCETRDINLLLDSKLFEATYKVVSETEFSNYIVGVKRSGEYRVSELLDSFVKGKDVLFLINPPYKNNSSVKSMAGNVEEAYSQDTNVRKLMGEFKVSPTDDLYLQFLFRICRFQELFGSVKIGLFAPSSLLVSEDKKKYRKYFLSYFSYNDGYVIQANQFAQVKGHWSIAFTLFDSFDKTVSVEKFLYSLKELSSLNISTDVGEKLFYSMDSKEPASKWVELSKRVTSDNFITLPCVSSAINITNKSKNCLLNLVGCLCVNGNKIETNQERVCLFSSSGGINGWKYVGITDENFLNVCSYFSARRLIISSWKSWQDEYMVPNTEHSLYSQWEKDCIVYSLFNNKSNQSSLRNVTLGDSVLSIYNEFFYLTREQVKNRVANPMDRDNINPAIEDDLRLHGEKDRFVALKLEEIYDDLSSDARAVLDYARELTLEMYNKKYRDAFNADHPEYHINTWDSGWYQVKGMLKEYKPEELKKFDAMYKSFSDRLRPLVYELGFLKK